MNSIYQTKVISFVESLKTKEKYNTRELYKSFIKVNDISKEVLSRRGFINILTGILKENNISYLTGHSGDERYIIITGKIYIPESNLHNTNKVVNPIDIVNIYRVTTTSHRHVNGLWSYKGKIFYRKRGVQSIINVTASNWNQLQVDLKATMKKLVK